MIRVDMHFHSTCSDGSDSPEALARLARRRCVAVAALTDHDTLAGVPAFLSACRKLGIRAISGVEISAEYPRTLHILGYNYNPEDADFQAALKTIQQHRDERNQKILMESLALFVRYQLTITAPLPEADRAGQALGRERFQRCVDQVGRQLASGRATFADPDEAAS